VIAAIALVGVVLFVAAGVGWTARLVHIGNLDALALAEKTAIPEPASALDWPEIRVRAVIPQPGQPFVVLLLVEWPGRCRTAILLVALESTDRRSGELLTQWCAQQAPVSPARCGASGLELRRRQSLQRVHGLLLAEDVALDLVRPHRPA
jgi:hypothetical protein